MVYPSHNFSSCDFAWGMRGNICKHVIKVSMFQGYDSMDVHRLDMSNVNIDAMSGGSPIMRHDYAIEEKQNIDIAASNENVDYIINEIDECDIESCQDIFL